MARKKIARSLVAQEADTGMTALAGAAIPHGDYTMLKNGRQPLRISDFLARGQENARSHKYLQTVTGLSNRNLRLAIQRERRTVPILSNCAQGYFLPNDAGDVNAFLRQMQHRSDEVAATAEHVRDCAPAWLDAQDTGEV